MPYVLVRDSRLALAQMSDNFFGHPAQGMKVIGVTGTNGKTTTTMLVKAILEESTGATVGLMGTNANYIGQKELPAQRTTPESYEVFRLLSEMKQAGCQYVVMEVSSHALELDRVYEMCIRDRGRWALFVPGWTAPAPPERRRPEGRQGSAGR